MAICNVILYWKVLLHNTWITNIPFRDSIVCTIITEMYTYSVANTYYTVVQRKTCSNGSGFIIINVTFFYF